MLMPFASDQVGLNQVPSEIRNEVPQAAQQICIVTTQVACAGQNRGQCVKDGACDPLNALLTTVELLYILHRDLGSLHLLGVRAIRRQDGWVFTAICCTASLLSNLRCPVQHARGEEPWLDQAASDAEAIHLLADAILEGSDRGLGWYVCTAKGGGASTSQAAHRHEAPPALAQEGESLLRDPDDTEEIDLQVGFVPLEGKGFRPAVNADACIVDHTYERLTAGLEILEDFVDVLVFSDVHLHGLYPRAELLQPLEALLCHSTGDDRHLGVFQQGLHDGQAKARVATCDQDDLLLLEHATPTPADLAPQGVSHDNKCCFHPHAAQSVMG
mmetsp:Transcript_47171/g.119604  ORF Transcript_47171/g.119604 Transcript_47171/m.119604 type:complete len:329 (+) Transcript_47171:86-1072(+)